MTDKQYAKQKQRILVYIDKWFKQIGLGWFKVNFVWDRSISDGRAGSTVSSWQYKEATITWFLLVTNDMSDDDIERLVVHEFSHVLLSGLAQTQECDAGLCAGTLSSQVNEYTTTLVTDALIWAREADKDNDHTKTGGK